MFLQLYLHYLNIYAPKLRKYPVFIDIQSRL